MLTPKAEKNDWGVVKRGEFSMWEQLPPSLQNTKTYASAFHLKMAGFEQFLFQPSLYGYCRLLVNSK
jgi:hypothetical protein